MGNRQVAGELFVSIKTVQFHLTHIYGKLGINNRAELAAHFRDTDTTRSHTASTVAAENRSPKRRSPIRTRRDPQSARSQAHTRRNAATSTLAR